MVWRPTFDVIVSDYQEELLSSPYQDGSKTLMKDIYLIDDLV